jgi:hypothetical protein
MMGHTDDLRLLVRAISGLSIAKACGEIEGGYTNFDPLLKLLQERGHAHEAAYTQHLRDSGKRVESGGDATRKLMAEGVDVITQASLELGAWHGRADCAMDRFR